MTARFGDMDYWVGVPSLFFLFFLTFHNVAASADDSAASKTLEENTCLSFRWARDPAVGSDGPAAARAMLLTVTLVIRALRDRFIAVFEVKPNSDTLAPETRSTPEIVTTPLLIQRFGLWFFSSRLIFLSLLTFSKTLFLLFIVTSGVN